MKQYHTVIFFDQDAGQWYDEFGSYSKREANAEAADLRQYHKRSHVKVITHDDTAEAMIAARDATPHPKH